MQRRRDEAVLSDCGLLLLKRARREGVREEGTAAAGEEAAREREIEKGEDFKIE